MMNVEQDARTSKKQVEVAMHVYVSRQGKISNLTASSLLPICVSIVVCMFVYMLLVILVLLLLGLANY